MALKGMLEESTNDCRELGKPSRRDGLSDVHSVGSI